ncbi:hypothetical protein NQ317_004708, partial [Molorchus minor]
MTSGKDTMGEQPIFTCKAHVFHIDPKTKRSWMPASSTAVSVSFFYDSSRSLYRIISVEGQKAVINSTVTPNMTFTKTSQKFGQWSDVRANTVYGLGFSSESELQKFIDKFNEVKEATRSAITKATANGGSAVTPVTSANASPITARAATAAPEQTDNLLEPPGGAAVPVTNAKSEDDIPHPRSHSISGIVQTNESPIHTKMDKTAYIGGSPNPIDMQLKYENDRLKLALAQSLVAICLPVCPMFTFSDLHEKTCLVSLKTPYPIQYKGRKLVLTQEHLDEGDYAEQMNLKIDFLNSQVLRERTLPCCFSPRVQFGGGDVIWRGISLDARTALIKFQGGSVSAD